MARPLVQYDSDDDPSFGPIALFGVAAHIAMIVLDARLVAAALDAVKDTLSRTAPLIATGLTGIILLHAVLLALAVTLAWQVSSLRSLHTLAASRRAERAASGFSAVMALSVFLVPAALAALVVAG